MKRFSLFTALLFFCQLLFSQDFIVKTNGDTIACQIKTISKEFFLVMKQEQGIVVDDIIKKEDVKSFNFHLTRNNNDQLYRLFPKNTVILKLESNQDLKPNEDISLFTRDIIITKQNDTLRCHFVKSGLDGLYFEMLSDGKVLTCFLPIEGVFSYRENYKVAVRRNRKYFVIQNNFISYLSTKDKFKDVFYNNASSTNYNTRLPEIAPSGHFYSSFQIGAVKQSLKSTTRYNDDPELGMGIGLSAEAGYVVCKNLSLGLQYSFVGSSADFGKYYSYGLPSNVKNKTRVYYFGGIAEYLIPFTSYVGIPLRIGIGKYNFRNSTYNGDQLVSKILYIAWGPTLGTGLVFKPSSNTTIGLNFNYNLADFINKSNSSETTEVYDRYEFMLAIRYFFE
jgi:opacity protein-like surface antigen